MTDWNLAPGTRVSDLYRDPLECECGHGDSEHENGCDECLAEDCDCVRFEPVYEDEWDWAA